MKRVALAALLMMAGCGSEAGTASGGLIGQWKAVVAGLNLTLTIEQAEGEQFLGQMSTTKSACFNSGQAAGSVTNASFTVLAMGAGSASINTIIQISGQQSGNTVTGLFEMTSAGDACVVSPTPVTLTR